VVETELISRQMRSLVEMDGSGLVPLLQADRFADLGRMYVLFKRVEGGNELLRQVGGAWAWVPLDARLEETWGSLLMMRNPYTQSLEHASVCPMLPYRFLAPLPPKPFNLQTMGGHLREVGKALVLDPERQKDPAEWVHRLLQVSRSGANATRLLYKASIKFSAGKDSSEGYEGYASRSAQERSALNPPSLPWFSCCTAGEGEVRRAHRPRLCQRQAVRRRAQLRL
jgi:hypothetical protein